MRKAVRLLPCVQVIRQDVGGRLMEHERAIHGDQASNWLVDQLGLHNPIAKNWGCVQRLKSVVEEGKLAGSMLIC